MYTDKEFEFINTLLRLSIDNTLTYSDIIMKYNLNYDLYNKLCTDINQNGYKLITTDGDNFTITTLGRYVATIGFKEYLEKENTKSDLEKQIKVLTLKNIKWTSIRGWIAIGISILALFVASLTYINKHNETKYNNTDNKTNPSNDTIDSLKVNNLPKSNIGNGNTTSTKMFSDSTKN